MDIIEYAKRLYAESELGAAVCGESLEVLWRNRPDIPDNLAHGFFDTAPEQPLCFAKETLLKCKSGEAARIVPFVENGEVRYLIELYPSISIQRLICASDKLKDLEVQNESARRLITRALTSVGAQRSGETPEQSLERMRREVSLSVLRVLSTNVNFGYLSRLMSKGTECGLISINTRLEQTLDYLAKILKASGTELVTDIAPRVTGSCDYYYLEAALLNIVINAHEYAKCGDKRVTVTLGLSGDRREYFLSVSDNGTDADLEMITAASLLGSGHPELDGREHLGLQFTRYYTELIGGRIELAPSETGGLTVTLTFPRENGAPVTDLCMDYKTLYNNIFDPCFCILAKAADPTVYEVKYDMQSLFSDIIRSD